jgi:chromosome segregation ATPase
MRDEKHEQHRGAWDNADADADAGDAAEQAARSGEARGGLWSFEAARGAALREGKATDLDRELALPPQRIVALRIPVLEETYEQLRQLITEQDWDEEEGLRTVLAAGLGFLRVRALEQARGEGRLDEQQYRSELSALSAAVAEWQAQYAVMKFRAYQFQEKARTLEMRVAGLRGEDRFREAWMLRARDRLEQLEAEYEQLKQKLVGSGDRAEGKSRGGIVGGAEPVDLAGWLRRLRTLASELAGGLPHHPEGSRGGGDRDE